MSSRVHHHSRHSDTTARNNPSAVPNPPKPHLEALRELPRPDRVRRQPAICCDLVTDSILGDYTVPAASTTRGHKKAEERNGEPEYINSDRRGEDEVHGRATVHVGHESFVRGGHAYRRGGRRSHGQALYFESKKCYQGAQGSDQWLACEWRIQDRQ